MKNTRKITVEIFRPGTFQSMEGKTTSFDERILSDIAGQYDSNDAPVVIGQPDISAPAYGWVAALKYDRQQQLFVAELGDIDHNFAEAAKAKRYKKISLSFFRPDAPANPKPGHYYLRYIGFLGAAAPAVTGLKVAGFAGAANDAITFKMNFSEVYNNEGLFSRFKNWLLEKVGADQAAAFSTNDEDAKLLVEPSRNENDNNKTSVLSKKAVDKPLVTAVKPVNDREDGKSKAKKANSFYTKNTLLDREKVIAEREKKTIHAANTCFADRFVVIPTILTDIAFDTARYKLRGRGGQSSTMSEVVRQRNAYALAMFKHNSVDKITMDSIDVGIQPEQGTHGQSVMGYMPKSRMKMALGGYL